MRIGEYWADEDRPTIDGDWIRGILVLGRQSKNPVDTDGSKRGSSKVTRKFNVICESKALYGKFDGTEAHIGPHRFDGSYPDDALMGTFHNAVSTSKGVRMDMKCRKIGEAYHPQCMALRDNIEHNRPFGGFSPLFDGNSDMTTGEVQSVDAVCSIDWVPNPGSVRSIMESEADEEAEDESYKKMAAELDKLRGMHEQLDGAHKELVGKHEKLAAEHEKIGEELEGLKGEHEELKGKHEALQTAHEELQGKHDEHEKQLGEHRDLIGECRTRMGESEAAIEDLKARDKEPSKEEEPTKIAESVATGGARTQTIPRATTASGEKVTNLREFVLGK